MPLRRVLATLALVASGALVASAAHAQGATAPRAYGRLAGEVTDSLSGRPLDGATIQLAPAEDPAARTWTATADRTGYFRIDSMPAGKYLIAFAHPLLDSLRLDVGAGLVTVTAGSTAQVHLATPSASSLRREYCGAQADSAAFGVLTGVLRDARTGMALAGGRVAAEVQTIGVHDGRLQRQTLTAEAGTAADGAFVLCRFPLGQSMLAAIAAHGGDTSAVLPFDLPASGILVRDIYVASAGAVAAVHGRVARADGAPLAGARIMVSGTTRQAVADDSGRFVLADVPEGTRVLYTRAIGFAPDQRLVDVADGAPPLDIRLPTLASVLDTVHVFGRRVFRDREDFERRKRMGFGSVFERADVERAMPNEATDLLRRTTSVRLAGTPGQEMVRVRGERCLPRFVLDGHPIPLLESVDEIDAWVRPQEIQAMEVYAGANAPAEYSSPGSCATILVWTNPAFSMPLPR